MTRFVDVPGFEHNYEVNQEGEVRNKTTGYILGININQYYTPYSSLLDENGRQVTRSLPLIVATVFLPNDNPYFDTPIQLDGDSMNCHVNNLMWRPLWFARKYNKQMREGRHWVTHPVRDVESGEEFKTARDCAVYYGLMEDEVVLSMSDGTPVWPTYQRFEAAHAL